MEHSSLRALLAMLATLSSQFAPQPATAQSFYQKDNWAVVTNEQSCTMLSRFEGDHVLYIGHLLTNDSLRIVLESENFGSVQGGDNFELSIAILRESEIVELYTKRIFRGLDILNKPAVQHFTIDGAKLLNELKLGDTLVLTFEDGAILGAYSLKGVGPAVDALQRCARAVAGFKPDDPFAGRKR